MSLRKKLHTTNLPKMMIIENKEVFEVNTIENEFNNFFSKIGPKLAAKINKPLINFQSYLKFNSPDMPYEALTSEEFNEAFETLKKNKSPGHDDINSNTLIYNKKRIKNSINAHMLIIS